MAIPDWLRKIPHPTYGNCGGGNLDCSFSGSPVDKMDQCFMEHDFNMYSARQMDTPEEVKSATKEADKILGKQLRAEAKLLPYYRTMYGVVYNRAARLVFSDK